MLDTFMFWTAAWSCAEQKIRSKLVFTVMPPSESDLTSKPFPAGFDRQWWTRTLKVTL